MPEISAKQVQALRAKTSLAMMDCKNALVEAGGDETKALELLRKRFAGKMSDRADKEAANGRIGVFADEQGAAVAELRCETDFVANNATFRELSDRLARQVARAGLTEVEALKASNLEDGRSVADAMVDAFSVIKENMSIRRAAKLSGPGACYVHHNGQVGVIISCDKPPGEAGRHVCMHIASTQLIKGLCRADVDAADVEEFRRHAAEEAKGKPPQILEKIVEGKLNRWFGERVILEQPFVMDDAKTVGAYAKEHGFTLQAYVKYEVGGLG